ncbi:MAG: RNA polymerase sigma-70 factor (ECF subfamily) [Alphaproteobacteria bacterium]|jgi:RNA polymerase sigma-70 factor (ECF subfamily)
MVTDQQAEQLVRENIGWMLRLAERVLRDPELAKDATQEAFINAFRGLESFEGRSSLKTWLHRITINASLNKLRQLKRLEEQSIDDYLPEFDQDDCRIELPWTHLASAQEIMESESLRAQVHMGIDALPESYRIVLQLRDIEGYDTKEVAEILEISDANVKVRLHRARSALKKLLEPVLRGEINS